MWAHVRFGHVNLKNKRKLARRKLVTRMVKSKHFKWKIISFDHTWPVLVIDCKWNEWGVWGKCDGVCGYRYRSRTSVGPFFGGKACLERDSVDKRPCKWVKVDGVTKRCRECFSPIKLKGLIMSILWNDSHFVSKPSIVDGKNGPSGVIATKKITRERERGASRVLTMTAKTARENQ